MHPNPVKDAANGRFVGFTPTQAEEIAVATLASKGMPQRLICEYVRRDDRPISRMTLRRYFKRELAQGRQHVAALIYYKLVMAAVVENNITAMIFYLKCQCRWAEKRRPKLGEAQQ
jgi:hypothetical protein